MDKIEQFADMINQSQKIVFFGGAGVSTESGIPDFRSSKGLYSQTYQRNLPAETIISHSFYKEHPAEFFDFYFEHLVFEEARPNVAHQFIADLEGDGKEVSVVTQNIDGLHQMAGSLQVYELHGSVLDNYCENCGTYYAYADLELDEMGIPRCLKDRGIVRPDIVLYEEQLDSETLFRAIHAINQADLLIVAGTSLAVYPAPGLIDYYRGDNLVIINKTPLHLIQTDALIFEDRIAHVFEQLK